MFTFKGYGMDILFISHAMICKNKDDIKEVCFTLN